MELIIMLYLENNFVIYYYCYDHSKFVVCHAISKFLNFAHRDYYIFIYYINRF